MAADGSIEVLNLPDQGATIALKAEALKQRFASGSMIAIALRTGPDLVITWLAALAAGFRPLVLQYPTRKQTRAYWHSSVLNTIEMIDCAGVVCDERVSDLLSGVNFKVIPHSQLQTTGTPVAIKEIDRFSIVQLSSGTTGFRKAIEFNSEQLELHVEDYNRTLELSAARGDHIVSWLPLYHDMGYLACFVMPLLLGIPITMMDPEVWLSDRSLLYKAIEQVRGTVCYMPNFGFEVMSRVEPADLSSMRLWISCSEPVIGTTVRRFLGTIGTDTSRFAACYAMAENVFAMSQSEGLREHEIDGVDVVSCGRPIAHVDVKTVDGEIWVRSRSSLVHYIGSADIRDAEGFYATGDLGTIIDGEIFITGRKRDLLIQAGKKFMLSTIDAVANELVAEAKGRLATIIVRDEALGTERPVLLIEAQDFFEAKGRTASIAQDISAMVGLDQLEVHFVPPRFLTKTSSGKINRRLSAKHWIERKKNVSVGEARSLAQRLQADFALITPDEPVAKVMDSLSITLLRIVLADAGIPYDPKKSLQDYAALQPAPKPEPLHTPLRIVSLVDRMMLGVLPKAQIDKLSEEIGSTISYEHLCLPPTPIVLSDLIFQDYFLPRETNLEAYEAVITSLNKLRAADVILIDDSAELHFPLSQSYPVLSHRLERSAEADLLAFRWQRYVERHDELPITAVRGSQLSLTQRKLSIDALSQYLGVPIFRIAGVDSLKNYTEDWDYRPLQTPHAQIKRVRYNIADLVDALSHWIVRKAHDQEISLRRSRAGVNKVDVTDLPHFCSNGVNKAALTLVLDSFQSFCIVGQKSSVPFIRHYLESNRKPVKYAASANPAIISRLEPVDCLLACGPTAPFEANAHPAFTMMSGGWPEPVVNCSDPTLQKLKFFTHLGDSSTDDWFYNIPENPTVSEREARQLRTSLAKVKAVGGMMEFKPKSISHPLTPPPATSNQPSVLAFSFAKGGSTLLFNMLRKVAPEVGLTYYSPADALFAANRGSNDRPTDIGDVFRPTGYCYGGFRSYPTYAIPILGDAPIVFLVRDPRDMVVSLYYSLLLSHTVPKSSNQGTMREELLRNRTRLANTSIDEFVLRDAVAQYRRMFESYAAQGFPWRPNVTTYRYEDVIFSKKEWLQAICRNYGWEVSADKLETIANTFDERPKEARPDKHIRNVTPGDHKHQLKPGTITQLNGVFKEYMSWFDYN